MRRTSRPSRSFASSGSHSRPQIALITFQPAPRNAASSSWMIWPLPRTGPSSRCRLQLMTKIRLSSFSRAGSVGARKEDAVAVAAVVAAEKMVEADFVERRGRRERRNVPADPFLRLVGAHDHRGGVPADEALDAPLEIRAAGHQRLLVGGD